MANHPLFDKLLAALQEANDLGNIAHILEWDGRTNRPPDAEEYRTGLAGRTGKKAHAAFIADEVGAAIEACLGIIGELTPYQQLQVSRLKASYDRAKALPSEFVGRKKATTEAAIATWVKARKLGDYGMFKPHLAEVLAVMREEAELHGGEPGNADSLYDQLLGGFEPGMTTAQARAILDQVKGWQARFMQRILQSTVKPNAALLTGCFPKGRQRRLVEAIVRALGYDFARGNLSETTHPFMATISSGDHRITTRYYENDLRAALFGTPHEAGHAMYEQGAPAEMWPVDNACLFLSLGIHESQSRMYENLVCRSKPFWEYWFRHLQMSFPGFYGSTVGEFYLAINAVKPSPIRVEADEATYNGHILARFITELALLSGDLSVDDAPDFFNEQVLQFVGYRPATPAEGILQDVHFPSGYFGYFPTYTFGNLASGQLFAAFAIAHPDWEDQFRQGNFSALLEWLRKNVHATGHFESMDNVLTRATGEGLNPKYWEQYMEEKYFPLYHV
ncbi:MAG: carboxypeptidase M32 [Patescibacteria group bacterium]